MKEVSEEEALITIRTQNEGNSFIFNENSLNTTAKLLIMSR